MRTWSVFLAGCFLLAACSAGASADPPPPPATTVAGAPTPVTGSPTPVTDDPYLALARTLRERGVRVWFETDLVAPWLEGRAAFEATVARLHVLAGQPGVEGFKIADEIGYHDGLKTAEQARAFLSDSRAALDRAAPGKEILVDAIVPELGCAPDTPATSACETEARRTSPAASFDAVGGYLGAGLVDRLDLSTGLLSPSTYSNQGTDRDRVQAAAWRRVIGAGWAEDTRLQARKALAAPGGYQGTGDQAARDLRTYVEIPEDEGAQATDIWTWRQPYDGATVSLLPPDLSANPLWDALVQQKSSGAVLFTHMTPSAMPDQPGDRAHECDLVARAFSAVFVAAGTG